MSILKEKVYNEIYNIKRYKGVPAGKKIFH